MENSTPTWVRRSSSLHFCKRDRGYGRRFIEGHRIAIRVCHDFERLTILYTQRFLQRIQRLGAIAGEQFIGTLQRAQQRLERLGLFLDPCIRSE